MRGSVARKRALKKEGPTLAINISSLWDLGSCTHSGIGEITKQNSSVTSLFPLPGPSDETDRKPCACAGR